MKTQTFKTGNLGELTVKEGFEKEGYVFGKKIHVQQIGIKQSVTLPDGKQGYLKSIGVDRWKKGAHNNIGKITLYFID